MKKQENYCTFAAMINLPEKFKTQMQNLLGKTAWNDFAEALQQPAPVSIRYNRYKNATPQDGDDVAWCNAGKYLAQRPVFTLDPLLHAGIYYVQEASSMFLEQVAALWREKTDLRILDLCASPGGKSTHLADLLPADSLLVSNETVNSRRGPLIENLTKWGNPNVVITHNAAEDFSTLTGFFDVMLVDAPCSGEGMFRKDPASIGEWSEEQIRRCVERQRHIVASAWDALADGGLLLYSTCTYNREENEDNVCWILEHLGAEMVTLPLCDEWNITANEYGYRFFPHKTKGEGFFISIMRKRNPTQVIKQEGKLPRFNVLNCSPEWVRGNFIFVYEDNAIQAFPPAFMQDIALLKQHLWVAQAGTPIGELKGEDIAPSAALAFSTALYCDSFPCEEVDLNTALRFLRRDAITLTQQPRDYILIRYQNVPLGFVKNLGVRSNNLYPPNWRIRMHIC
ncbi:MAG: rRNA cytosine-C5-methyltransferase [Prevotellaceae bacterium]|jgi:16S rRNA C967 or C1407 C5-methylase (RsmB/RsmF family)/NOL1/NOP2/fmu family ribosome biogenesis protein|nr:rRNA cytosine-C5-methyltransferase [Prevotellaceae bacterium]